MKFAAMFAVLVIGLACCQNTILNSSAVSTALVPEKGTEQSAATGRFFLTGDHGKTWFDLAETLPKGANPNRFFVQNEKMFLVEGKTLYTSPTSAAPNWNQSLFLGNEILGAFTLQSGNYILTWGSDCYKELFGTGSWAPVFSGLKDQFVRTIVESGDAIVVGGDGGILKSADGGKTWKKVFDASFAYDMLKANDGSLIASGDKGILRSVDQGETWIWAFNEDGQSWALENSDIGLLAITNGTKEKVFRPASDSIQNHIQLSKDNGKTWSSMSLGTGLSKKIHQIVAVAGYLYCCHTKGISRSMDGGKTWELMLEASKDGSFHLQVSGNMIFATLNTGC